MFSVKPLNFCLYCPRQWRFELNTLWRSSLPDPFKLNIFREASCTSYSHLWYSLSQPKPIFFCLSDEDETFDEDILEHSESPYFNNTTDQGGGRRPPKNNFQSKNQKNSGKRKRPASTNRKRAAKRQRNQGPKKAKATKQNVNTGRTPANTWLSKPSTAAEGGMKKFQFKKGGGWD